LNTSALRKATKTKKENDIETTFEKYSKLVSSFVLLIDQGWKRINEQGTAAQ